MQSILTRRLGSIGIDYEKRTVNDIERLALDIAQCSALRQAVIDTKHPCHQVVNHQTPVEDGFRHVPEAWAGDLAQARILFVSSNPSISTPENPQVGEDYPLGGFDSLEHPHSYWPQDRLIDFQTNRLDQNRDAPYVNSRAQFLCRDGEYRGGDKASSTRKSQNYWKNAFDQSADLLGPNFDLSADFCMTEIVHCKSKSEAGARKAAPACADRFLHRILDLSSARLVVIVGSVSRDIVMENYRHWSSSATSSWEISPKFGRFKDVPFRNSDHVGLINTAHRQHVVVAVQQLSWATNTYRMVSRVVGDHAKVKLQDFLRTERQESFENREDLLRHWGLSQ